jgi:hypothetical protein
MITSLSALSGAVLKLLSIAIGALYVGIVLMKYCIDGPHHPLRLRLHDPVTSAEHLAVGLGVEIVGACVAMIKLVLNILLEASAEVGEWTMRLSPEMQKAIRSRFLM